MSRKLIAFFVCENQEEVITYIPMKNRFSKYEKKLLDSVEAGEWKSVKGVSKEIQRYQQYAHDTLRKNERINIRLSHQDLTGIRSKAVREGIPYQTLIASILHKYVVGRLVEA